MQLPLTPSVPTPGGLRPYQVEAVTRIEEELVENRSTILVAATGTGKTQVFAEVIANTKGRALVLAHRDELIQQAVKRIEQRTGRIVSVEKADSKAGTLADVVVASVQTITRDRRLLGFGPNEFALVVADEAHHYCAPSFKKILDYFKGAKILGVTATPDRADRLALGSVFESVAYVYDIEDAIKDGWLCPIRATSVIVQSMDLSNVKTVAGDLDAGELDAVMSAEKVLHGIVKPVIELAEGRRTLVFTTSVENAHRMAEIFGRYREGCARAVDGGMALDERRKILADHQAGAFQYLVNCAITTEGYDDPAIACIVMSRPTKSRSLYTQMAGRGTRLCPGKEDLLLLDFVGNSGRHRLVTAADILAGRHPDEVVDAAKAIIQKNPGIRTDEAIKNALEEIERRKKAEETRRAAIRAKVKYATEQVNPFGPSPFDVLGVKDPLKQWGNQFGSEPASEAQLALVVKMKLPVPQGCTKQQASKLIGTVFDRRRRDLCSFGQSKTLQKFGYDTKNMPFRQAKTLLDALAQNRWKPLPLGVGDGLLSREPGDDG